VIKWANPAVTELTGFPREQLIGAHTRLFGSGRQPREFYETLWHTALSGGIWRGELVNRREDGSEYREAMAITPVKDPDGEIEHFVAVKQDVTERYAAEESIRELNADLAVQLARITALHQIDVAITGGTSLEAALQAFVRSCRSGLGVDAAAVFVPTSEGRDLELMETLGFRNPPGRLTLPRGHGVAGRAASTGQTHVVRGRDQVIDALSLDATQTFVEEGFEAVAVAPMLVRGAVRGALMVAHRAPLEVSTDWLTYLEGVATQGAILVDNTSLLNELRTTNDELRAAYDATIEGWSRALDLRDKETEGHSRRVTKITLRLARAMGLPEEALVHVRRGALLHDIGKMGVPDAILQKPGKLTEQESATMRLHTTFARDLLAPIAFLGPALDIPYSHHERWDGSGYPQGLEGEAIPMAARIFAIADVYDALTSDRPYRPAWSRERTLAHIRQASGGHFDPAVVSAFLALQHDLAR
jgi:PAS domain S-box-containing protein/putative nucleotidyltransferase with HDIG domain